MGKDELSKAGMHNGASPSIFRNAEKLREMMTASEKKLWEYLKTKPMGYKFRRQHPIGVFVLDFYCHKLRISIEIDGGYHLVKKQKENDKSRTEYLKNVGIDEIRFTNNQVLNDYKNLCESINLILCVDSPLGAGGSVGQE